MSERPEHLVHPSKGTEGSTEGTELLVESTSVVNVSERFAFAEDLGARIGFVLVLVTFFIYITGLVAAHVAIPVSVQHLADSVAEFSQATGHPTGWDWVANLGYSDTMAMGSLVFLSSVIVAAFLAIVPALVRGRDWLYLGMVAAQLAVFAIAASGLGGGH